MMPDIRCELRRGPYVLACALSALAAAGLVHAQSYARVPIDLGTLGGASANATDVNNQGQVVGSASLASGGGWHAFLWEAGVMRDLGTLPGGSSSTALSINDAGHVVGWGASAAAPQTAFLWRDGSLVALPSLGGAQSQANAINEHGQIAGWSLTPASGLRACLWANGAPTAIPTLGGPLGGAYDVNELGQVVGLSHTGSAYHGFLWDSRTGVLQDLDEPSDIHGDARAINDASQVVGWRIPAPSGPIQAYLSHNGTRYDLDPAQVTALLAINNRAEALGIGADGAPILWHNGSLVDVASTFPAGSAWRLHSLAALNDHGAIVGTGSRGGATRALLLSEPCHADVGFPLAQDDARWRDDIYDHCDAPAPCRRQPGTLGQLGCAVTALAMALRASGATELPAPSGVGVLPLTPQTLNDFMVRHDGYDNAPPAPSHTVRWSHATATVDHVRRSLLGATARLRFNETAAGLRDKDTLQRVLCSGDKGRPTPVILHVPPLGWVPPAAGACEPGHYVVAVGVRADGLIDIVDPLGGRMRLLDPDFTGSGVNRGDYACWAVRGFVEDPLDLSVVLVGAGGPIDLLLSDEQGRRTGIDGGRTLRDIPRSGYALDQLRDDVDGSEVEPEARTVSVRVPAPGRFVLDVAGRASGAFSLAVSAVDADGLPTPQTLAQGVIAAGATRSFELQWSGDAGQAPELEPRAQPDQTPPVISVPVPPPFEATGAAGAVVEYVVSVVDETDPAPSLECVPASGSAFPLGTTTVVCTASDAAGNVASAGFEVHVVDTTPPALEVAASPGELWPPNHRLVAIALAVTASDAVDAQPVIRLDSVACDDACAPDDMAGAAVGADDREVFLRATRRGQGSGRRYELAYTATDASGNVTRAVAAVSVPHDSRPLP